MKKILCAFCALALGTDIYALDADAGVEEQGQQVDDQNNKNNHDIYNGLYFGAGINATSFGESSSYRDAGDNTDEKMSDESRTRLGGGIVLGFGRKMPNNPFYIGLEVVFDFAPNSNFSQYDKVDSDVRHFYDLYGKRSGCSSNFGVRFGWMDSYRKILIFVKLGGTWSKTTLHYDEYESGVNGNPRATLIGNSDVKISRVVPTIGLGFEIPVGRKVTFLVELSSELGKSKEALVYRTAAYDAWLNNPANGGVQPTINDNDRVKFEKKSTVVGRVEICYHINCFK